MNAPELLDALGPGAVAITGCDQESLEKYQDQAKLQTVVEMLGKKFLIKELCWKTEPGTYPGPLRYCVVFQQLFENPRV